MGALFSVPRAIDIGASLPAGHFVPACWQFLPKSGSEAKKLGESRYFTGKLCRYGHRSCRSLPDNGCLVCKVIKVRNLDERQRQKAREANRGWRERNLEDQRARERRWHKENPEKSASRAREQYRKNSKRIIASVIARDKRVRQATPPWADMKAIKAFYEARPDGFHVDHIVPLRGKNICGLHVLENLQYLPASENCSKGNRFDG